MNFADPSTALLAACGGDSVKVFDVSEDTGSDPCMLSYSPSPGFQVNSVKWNHTNFFYVHLSPQLQPPTPPALTMAAAGEGHYLFKESDLRKRKGDFNFNLVIASAGDDKRISLWRKNGQSMGTVPPLGTNAGDNIDESISAISFSNKGSRYLCSGGSGQIVRVWDLQRKRCIKWLRGHTDTITGVMCNCKDEHLASISLKGDLILHNLASGARAAELKDPNEQVLRVLDYSRISRHVLVTAGDNGSVHLWDTTGRSPKVSWLKQHSAPTTGVCFSPSNDKMIASVGLDKKLYTFDSGTRRPTSCVPYEAPFSSLAFRDDGWTLAAGTSSGRVVFYDVRGKPQPYTVLRAYSSSEAITSLCWQRSKPINVNESTCTAETALLGGSEDSILMPDPLPSLTSSSLSSSTAVSTTRNSGRPMSSIDASPLTTTSSGSISTAEVTPQRNHLSTGGGLSRLHPPRSSLNLSDDMEVFSPLVDVQPITPSLSNWWSDQNETKKDNATNEKKSASLVFPLSGRKFPYTEEGNMDFHQISDWKSNPALRQDDTQSTVSQPSATSSKSEQSFNATPPEAWGGEALSDKLSHHRSALSKPSRFVTTSGSLTSGALMSSSTFAGLQESSASTSHTAISSLTNTSLITNLHGKDISNHEALSGLSEPSSTFPFSSIVSSLGTKNSSGQANLDVPGLMSVALPRRYSTYADRISTISSFSDGASYGLGSPKLKKTGAETREELVNSLLSRSDTSGAAGMGALPIPNGVTSQPQKGLAQPDHQQQGASSFTLQLVQRTLEETLTSVQKSIHEDMRNLHIELLRQFHIQETEMSSVLNSVLEKQAELMKEVQALRKEHQQLRQLL